MKYHFNEEDIQAIQAARRENQDKNAERRLRALELRAEERTGKEVAAITGYNLWYISKLAAKYCTGGLDAIIGSHHHGNHRNMSYEEETAFLEQFIDEAEGRITNVSAVKAAYDKKIGRETGRGQIYYVLHRHGWTKKTPKGKHPKRADPEAAEVPKK